ncbi:murein lytic transglycosylase YjbJ [Clostridium aceticum]|uniref:Murein lytic transglycosylase YjbJ n=1 Tax=Clostridium aceticum TaxID=84022 RepID=A0A0D8ICZ3_9CLOT|nr:lytic transglycosylase domain-containing protein [Clostridium aceticum]AKL95074.1 murein lytic transglycosylase YjbJ [Clostridium aceticum]KJF27959.1 hypothetical protein TZ02_05175 [Clostridium aceticum]
MIKNFVNDIFSQKMHEIQKRIPVNLNFSTPINTSFGKVLSNEVSNLQKQDFPKDFDKYIDAAAQKYNLSPALIKSVIKAESNFNPKALSRAGAQGLMQLMPATARELQVTDVWNPQQNIEGGAKYLRQLLNQFEGNLPLSLAAYNAGPGNVNRYGGIPPFAETQNYVKSILENLSVYT